MCKIQSRQFHRPLILKYNGWITIFILFAISVSSGCGGMKSSGYDDPLADHSFVTGKPCDVPCWYGLELDSSNQQEVIDTLNRLSFVDASSVFTYTSNWKEDDNATGINFGCVHPALKNCGAIAVSDDRLKFLSLAVGFPLTLESVVSKLGPPDYIHHTPIVDSGGCILMLFWPDKNMEVTLHDPEADSLCHDLAMGKKIPPTLLATDVTYMVKEGFGSLSIVFPWPGFSEP